MLLVPVAAEFTQAFCKLDPRSLRVGIQKMRDIYLLGLDFLICYGNSVAEKRVLKSTVG